MGEKQLTLFALDCGATNWRLCRCEYNVTGSTAQLLGEPQPVSLTSFVDRKLPAAVYLNAEGTAVEGFGEVAQQQLEDEQSRERVREYFKPCLGSYLELNPLPHQKRYTHAQAIAYTRLLLAAVLEQIRQEKWRSAPFDDRVCFTLAYPLHWRHDHQARIYNEFVQVVQACFPNGFENLRFVAEPEGAILHIQRHGLLGKSNAHKVTLIIDIGGSTTDIVAGQVDPASGKLNYLGRYGEPFGGGLYDAELAKYIADTLQVPASAMADDPSALVALRLTGQRLKESLSRQLLHAAQVSHVPQRTVTLVMQDGSIYRRVIALDEPRFREICRRLDQQFHQLIDTALATMAIPQAEIGQAVLVGGGAQLFTVFQHLSQRFGEQHVILADNPEEIVAQGIGLEYAESRQAGSPSIEFSRNASTPVQAGCWSLVDQENTIYPLAGAVTKIGRGTGNDIQINDLKASRFHAELHINGVALEIVDLGSTNGTYVNLKRILPNQPQAMQAGDEISIGKLKFACKYTP